ncbi:MAG: helix-hairpin-helix domain-containing protein [Candidatus Omnitrophota bacterium]
MFNLTQEERRVILFLLAVALLGLGINFAIKVNSPIVSVLVRDDHFAKVNLNQANPQDLLSLTGITPKLAESIIAYRNAKGAFGDIEELKQIKGIGEYRYEKLKDLFYVE